MEESLNITITLDAEDVAKLVALAADSDFSDYLIRMIRVLYYEQQERDGLTNTGYSLQRVKRLIDRQDRIKEDLRILDEYLETMFAQQTHRRQGKQ